MDVVDLYFCSSSTGKTKKLQLIDLKKFLNLVQPTSNHSWLYSSPLPNSFMLHWTYKIVKHTYAKQRLSNICKYAGVREKYMTHGSILYLVVFSHFSFLIYVPTCKSFLIRGIFGVGFSFFFQLDFNLMWLWWITYLVPNKKYIVWDLSS